MKLTNSDDPIVGPPIYGCWQAARHQVNLISPPPLNWLDELNLDPRQRVVAAFGTQVVQSEQEDLMASAWEQLGQIQRVNQIRRQAQFGPRGKCRLPCAALQSFLRRDAVEGPRASAVAHRRRAYDATRSHERCCHKKSRARRCRRMQSRRPLRRLTNSRGVLSTRFATAGTPTVPRLFHGPANAQHLYDVAVEPAQRGRNQSPISSQTARRTKRHRYLRTSIARRSTPRQNSSTSKSSTRTSRRDATF